MALGQFKIVDQSPQIRDANSLRLTLAVHTAILTGEGDWRGFWNEFRLDLQSRLAGISDDRSLHKLQGKIELVDEIEQVFQKITSSKPTV